MPKIIKCLKTGIELKYPPSKMTKKAKELLIDYLDAHQVIDKSLGKTLEYAYCLHIAKKDPDPICPVMSQECATWAGLKFRGGFLQLTRYKDGFSKGFNHSFGSIFKCGPVMYKALTANEIAKTIPTHD